MNFYSIIILNSFALCLSESKPAVSVHLVPHSYICRYK